MVSTRLLASATADGSSPWTAACAWKIRTSSRWIAGLSTRDAISRMIAATTSATQWSWNQAPMSLIAADGSTVRSRSQAIRSGDGLVDEAHLGGAVHRPADKAADDRTDEIDPQAGEVAADE